MPNTTIYRGVNSMSGPSPNIWANFPTLAIMEDPTRGTHLYDDFRHFGLQGTLTTAIQGVNGAADYELFASTGGTIANVTPAGGVLMTETDDNESTSVREICPVITTKLGGGNVWFEASVQTNVILTNEQALFIGFMGDTTLLVGAPLTTTGVLLTTANFVGFHKPEANTATIDAAYQANGVTPVKVIDDVATFVADTAIKLGFTVHNDVLTFYVDGVKNSTTYDMPTVTAGTDFPDDVVMGPCAGQIIASQAGTNTLQLNWWRAGSVNTDGSS